MILLESNLDHIGTESQDKPQEPHYKSQRAKEPNGRVRIDSSLLGSSNQTVLDWCISRLNG